MSTKISVTHDLCPTLSPEQQAFLDQEARPCRRETAKLGPYPLTPEMASAIKAMQQHYVLSWPLVRERHLALWARDVFVAQGARDIPLITPPLMTSKLKVFSRIGNARQYWAGTDFQYGLADVPDALFEGAQERILANVAALALEEPLKAGAAVFMPDLPFGPSALRHVPLLRRMWIDQEILSMCEAGALLVHNGMVRLPPADPHPLAWCRFFDADSDWTKPRPVKAEVIAEALQQARANLSGCPGKAKPIGGRPHINVEQYFAWSGRHVDEALEETRVEGLIVSAWNDWIDKESEGGLVEVGGYLVGKVEHPCPLFESRDYQVCPGPRACRDALAQREAALANLCDSLTAH
jgi:hypothetical protein